MGIYFNNIIESYSGYIQVQNRDFLEDRIVDNSFEVNHELENKLLADENVKNYSPF